jgi:uncharacterized protein (TIGR02246 family)
MKSSSRIPMSQIFLALRLSRQEPSSEKQPSASKQANASPPPSADKPPSANPPRSATRATPMSTDELEIRQLVLTWMEASKAGDVDKVLSLMSDDVVFLVPGEVPMRKSDFAASARAQSGPNAPKIDGSVEIQELKVLGDWAFLWTKLRVSVTPPGASTMTRAGHTLTIVKKENGKWVLARDANMLVPETH